jgi:hypothetical protein
MTGTPLSRSSAVGTRHFTPMIAALFAASCLDLPLIAQQALPAIPELPFNQYTAYCGLWRTDGGFQSTIRLRNSLTVAAVDAVVTLYMADGTSYTLPPMHLPQSAVATINVNDALARVPSSLAGRVSTFGSATMTYRYSFQGAVYASMSLLDSVRSLQYNYSFVFPMEAAHASNQGTLNPDIAERTVLEGLWWRFRPTSGGFIALANVSTKDIAVNVTASDGSGNTGSTLSVLVPSRATKLVALSDALGQIQSPYGGVRVDYQADMDSVLVSAGLEDDSRGYSANLPLAMPPMSPPACRSAMPVSA